MATIILQNPKFHMGLLVITRNADRIISQDERTEALQRHLQCDWGDICENDRNLNDLAFKKGGRLFSEYYTGKWQKFWIITDAAKTATTILVPED